MTKLALAFLLLIPCLAWAQATQPSLSSAPAVKDGLQIVVTLPTATFAADDPLTFTVQFKNVSKKPISLCDAEHFWAWRIQFWDSRSGGTWRVNKLFFEDKKRAMSTTSLKPGETFDVPVLLDPGAREFEYKWDGADADPLKVRPSLAPGQYQLRVGIRFISPAGPAGGFWIGSIAPKPIELQITGK